MTYLRYQAQGEVQLTTGKQGLELELDRAGTVLKAAELTASLFGTTPAIMAGRNMMSFVPAGMHETFYAGWTRIVDGKRKTLLLNCEHNTGYLVPLEMRLLEHYVVDETERFKVRLVDRSRRATMK